MRHRKRSGRLGRRSGHRKALLKNLASSLLIHQEIQTTLAKAKEARRLADTLITLGKKGDLHHRRLAFSVLGDRRLVSLLFTEIAPRFQNRPGGYTRIIRTSNRGGDGAQLAILELTEKKVEELKPRAKPEKKPPVAKKPPPKERQAAPEAVPPKEEKPLKAIERKEKPPKEKKEEVKEKPKTGFLKGLRKFFGRGEK